MRIAMQVNENSQNWAIQGLLGFCRRCRAIQGFLGDTCNTEPPILEIHAAMLEIHAPLTTA